MAQKRPSTMNLLSLSLKIAIGLLMVDSIMELAFVSSMVAWLHARAGGDFEINYNGSSFQLHGKPKNLLVDQGHTTNGAAGTAFVLIGLGGILALYLRYAASKSTGIMRKVGMLWYHFWLVMTLPSMLLTLAALIYTHVVDSEYAGQVIDENLASSLSNQPYPHCVAYPLDVWTPPDWFAAVLQLDLASSSDRSDIQTHLNIMYAWSWNLIPMFILGLVVSVLAFMEAFHQRRRRAASVDHAVVEGKRSPI